MRSPWVMLPLVMILAGALGGMVNYYLAPADDPAARNLQKSLALGVVASLMVPLFLSIVNSQIVDNVAKWPPPIVGTLVFLGLCLVASASSTSFIRSLSGRVLKELEETKKVAQGAKKDADLILQKETEQEPGSEGVTAVPLPSGLKEDERKILRELADGKFVLRTRTSVARETGIEKAEVDRIMSDLARRGLTASRMVVTPQGVSRRRWHITEEGRAAIAPG